MNLKKYAPYVASLSLLSAGLAAPSVASAEVSASLAISNMYLWRGTNLSQNGGVVSGSLDYSHESGFYAGAWASSEDGGHETDLYLGYGGEAGGFGYDVSYIYYMYPEDLSSRGSNKLGDNTFSEIALKGSMAGFGLGVYVSTDTYNDGESDWVYYTLDYTAGPVNILYGAWVYDDDLQPAAAGPNAGNPTSEYSHVTVSYSYNDNLSFAVSLAQDDEKDDVETDPLFAVSYSFPIE